ncbi:peptidyl-prolyl cis-trans isomerase [Pontibaca salina]|uniref:SurA N-terminal domain-containing protein n=1 Tax=Pontibaca salina TaxID=2795731 RepID=A0A934HRX5_9RHOB|nr:peptidyl-prolyl cis-trans isomerase [Pontibaca salina]MBI6629093.1 SurA N-terminal domain-containing protein [Pontibaca salina]
MAFRIKSLSKTFVWIILGLLIVGLAGFGATNLSGSVRTVATVGDHTVSVDQYARELQREIRAIEAQTGQALPMSQVEAMGLNRQVLSRLVALAALDNEAELMGLSIGDANLHREIIQIAAFQGVDGKFDREAYRFALEQAGLNESVFESDLRAESARTLLQTAIVGGVEMPDILADTLTEFLAARRSFTWAPLSDRDLIDPLPIPTEDELKAFYETHQGDFTLPESKRLTYTHLSPRMLLDEVKLDETGLRELYEQRSAEYSQPERRLVERLVFPDDAAASNAKAQLGAGGTTFEALTHDRGLELHDIDLGDVRRDELGEASAAIFDAGIGDVVGPLPSALGPALFRVNGILEARETSFEDAEPELRKELAAARARRLIETRAQEIDDMLAAGATLEDLARETDMEIGQIEWSEDSADGIAAYEDFREVASAATPDDFPEIGFFEDGSIFALRVDEVLPSRPEPFETARDRVVDTLNAQLRIEALTARGDEVIAALDDGQSLGASVLEVTAETGLTRNTYLNDAPNGFMQQVFEMEPGEMRVVSDDATVAVVQLDATLPPAENAELAELRRALNQELDQALASALFEAYAMDVQIRAKPQVDQRALTAVQSSFQ